jgi:type VI secretion system secreted protein Hcp
MFLLISLSMESQTAAEKKAAAAPNGVVDPSPASGVAPGAPQAAKEQRTYTAGRFMLDVDRAVPFTVISVRDSASGLPTGKRMHKPFVITKEIDSASPQLLNAMTSHRVLPALDIEYPDASPVSCASAQTPQAKVGQGSGGGKASLQDISILKVEKVSPTTEEITIDYATMKVTRRDGAVVCADFK